MTKYRKIPIANMKRDMTVRSPKPNPELAKSPSPHSYPEKDTNWKSLSHKPSISRFSVLKDEKQGRFLDSFVKTKKFVPGPGAHKETGMAKFTLLYRGP